jgi:superfamily II DNA or RNA helicase
MFISKSGKCVCEIDKISYMKYIEIRTKLMDIYPWKKTKYKIKPINIFKQTKKYIIIPRIFGIETFGFPKKILLNNGLNFDGKYKSLIKMRDYQQKAVDKIYNEYKKGIFGGCLIMPTGSGKTLTSIQLALKINKKTLIIVNTKSLANQWRNEIKKNIGEIISDDFKIYILASIYRGKYKWSDFINYGLTIIDEVHIIPTQSHVKIFNYISRRFILGLTATPKRLDGLEIINKYFIGNILYKIEKIYEGLKPKIYIYNHYPKNIKILKRKDGKVDYIETYKSLCFNKDRLEIIKKLIIKFVNLSTKTIIIGPYRKLLDLLYEKLKDLIDIGIYYSVKTKHELEMQKKTLLNKKNILAINFLAKQSLNIYDCDCLILLVSPFIQKDKENKKNTLTIDQYIGRVLRKKHIKSPKIILFDDNFWVFKKHSKTRIKFFQDKKWEITYLNFFDI